MFDVVQIEKHGKVKIDRRRDDNLTVFGKETLKNNYLQAHESFQDLFARVASYYSDDDAHAQRLYDYISNLWFMPATPVLSNGGTDRGLPISCYLNDVEDSMTGIVGMWNEIVWLACLGGGIGTYWGNVRSIGEPVKGKGKTSGIVPFIRVTDSMTMAISQGSLRRASTAAYLPVSHPEIEEFIDIRRPTGGDPNRKALNIHNAVTIPDAFMRAVENDEQWPLISPRDGSVIRKIQARDLWIRILTARIETGEPYILFIDHVNRAIPEHHKMAGLSVKTSNLCSEITLPTGIDRFGQNRTAVCCLSSVNLEFYEEWENHPTFIEDIMRFLDNVLTDYINKAPDTMTRAVYSAKRERSVGLGVMGLHSFFQKKMVPFESVMAKVWNKRIFQNIKQKADSASVVLAQERGACPDAEDFGIMERFSNKIAIAPTASISIICGGASPGIEPSAANAFTQKTLAGSFSVRNPYLKKILAEKGQDNEDVWSSITINGGSVQHLDFLSEQEKMVFRTAFELDQRWLIDLAGDRSQYICQAQSLNVFLPANCSKKVLHDIHWMAWKKGVKSLYYCRSLSVQRAESSESAKMTLPEVPKVLAEGEKPAAAPVQLQQTSFESAANDSSGPKEAVKVDECLACQ